MDRRLTGALLVVAVLTVAITVPALGGLRVAGAPSMIQLPADPGIGDCLAASLDHELGSAGRGADAISSAVWRDGPPEAANGVLGFQFTSCGDQPAVGEVVAIIHVGGNPQTRRERVENGAACRDAGLRYAGLLPVGDHFELPGQPSDDPVTWRLTINQRSSWILPSPLLQAAGRTWAACVVAPLHRGSFTGKLANAFDGGTMPSEYGTCWNSREVSASIEAVDCGQPHLAELVAAGSVIDRSTTSTDDVKDSCKRLAARVTGRSDPTVGGTLVIRTSPDRSVSRGSEISASVLCYFTARDRYLTASLFGLGDRPVPYAN